MNPALLALLALIGPRNTEAVAIFLDAIEDDGLYSVRPSTLAKEIREAVAAENAGWGEHG